MQHIQHDDSAEHGEEGEERDSSGENNRHCSGAFQSIRTSTQAPDARRGRVWTTEKGEMSERKLVSKTSLLQFALAFTRLHLIVLHRIDSGRARADQPYANRRNPSRIELIRFLVLHFGSLAAHSAGLRSSGREKMSAIASKAKAVDYATPPSPSYILRGHTAQISVLAFSLDAKTLYSGSVHLSVRSFVEKILMVALSGILTAGSRRGISRRSVHACSGKRMRAVCSRSCRTWTEF